MKVLGSEGRPAPSGESLLVRTLSWVLGAQAPVCWHSPLPLRTCRAQLSRAIREPAVGGDRSRNAVSPSGPVLGGKVTDQAFELRLCTPKAGLVGPVARGTLESMPGGTRIMMAFELTGGSRLVRPCLLVLLLAMIVLMGFHQTSGPQLGLWALFGWSLLFLLGADWLTGRQTERLRHVLQQALQAEDPPAPAELPDA